MYDLSLFIFRRDLRLNDNTGLIESTTNSKNVIPLFILTPAQVSDKNKLKSSNSIQFMMESLIDLDKQITKINPKCRLWIFYGDEIKVISKIYKEMKFDAIYVNEDYTPYSIKRDKLIENFCKTNELDFFSSTDCLLLGTNEITANNGNYYKNFTQFLKKTSSIEIQKPNNVSKNNFKPLPQIFKNYTVTKMNKFLLQSKFYEINDLLAVHGGTTNGLKILKNIGKFKNYEKTRDFPSIPTTMLSAHNKFGTVSIRQVYQAFKNCAKSKTLCQQLYWRDFYYYVCFHYPQTFKHKHLHHLEMTKDIKWDDNMKWFRLWCKGQTGFPIVDAAMNQLNTTGYMHNRCRMIVAMFLVKDLMINWKYGERYFTKKLVDIDRCQNVGNWNWSSSFGLDNASFLRIFNPWTQGKDFDPNCEYIKEWLPVLKDVPNKHIHQWDEYYSENDVDYFKPIVEHEVRRKRFFDFYKKVYFPNAK